MKEKLKQLRSYMTSYYWPLFLATPLAPIVDLFEKYVFSDWEFVRFLIILIAIDTLLSWGYHLFIERDFSSKGFSQIFMKLIVYSILLILAHVMSSYRVNGEPSTTLIWMRSLICTALIIRESISIVEKLVKLNPKLVPSFILKYLKEFDKNGFIENPPKKNRIFRNKNKEEDETI